MITQALNRVPKTTSVSCSVCEKTFKGASKLKSHQQVHASSMDIILTKCDLCMYEAKNESQVNRHKQAAHQENVQCMYCSFEATTKYSLKQHTRAKHKESKFMCKLCDFKAN